MNNLKTIEIGIVPVYETDTGIKIVNGRELHEALQSKQDFSTWVKKRLSECDAIEEKDFERFHKKMEANNATMIEYFIKLNTAKEMAMLERNEKGKNVRKYFISVEEKYKQSVLDMSELSPELQMFNKLFNSVAKQELEQKRQAEQIKRIEENQKLQTNVPWTTSTTLVPLMSEWSNRNLPKVKEICKVIGHKSTQAFVMYELYQRLGMVYNLEVAKRIYQEETKSVSSIQSLELIEYFPQLQEEAEKILDEMLEEKSIKKYKWN